MAKIPLTTGAYQSRSIPANAQRCVNLYMEKNPEDSAFPFTCYPSPGLILKATATDQGWRGLYTATNLACYGVCGSSVYQINADMSLTNIGTIGTGTGPVEMVDNATYMIIVDGSSTGYQVTLADNTFAPITQDSFYGGNSVAFVDGYFVLNRPGTYEWYISLADQITFDPTDFASKAAYLDNIVAVAVVNRYIYLFGTQTTEVWFNLGGSIFPFSILPGIYMQYGCTSAASIAQMDGQLYWLTQSPQGHAMVCRTEQQRPVQISTLALDNEIGGYARIDDAIGFTYQLAGHFFYVLTFPTADKTWQFDLSSGQWNELSWLDTNGDPHRHRAGCHAFAFGIHLVGDWQNGNLYQWDLDTYTDNGQPITRLRSFAHIVDGNQNRMIHQEVIAQMETGNGDGGSPIPVFLRWSDSAGRSWGNAISQSLGVEGEYLKSILFRRLGMARDRVYELSWSAPVKTSLSGMFLTAQSNRT